ncbi:MAG: phospholipase D family protein [Betaproteobacteria bacterium]|nr:phospholipase D family protein [Betaproteobacteria bacterium]
MKKLLALIAVELTTFLLPQAHTEVNFLFALAHAGNLTAKAPTTAQIEVGFSPDEGAENLVLKTIGAARTEIRVLSYSFTSAPITQALLAARRRGVDVAMIVDHKNNIAEDRSGKAKHALNALAHAGVRIRTISIYPIHHDKTLIVDGRHVETESFNFSDAAAHRNSENVIVLWNHPDLAQICLRHWQDRYARGRDYLPG